MAELVAELEPALRVSHRESGRARAGGGVGRNGPPAAKKFGRRYISAIFIRFYAKYEIWGIPYIDYRLGLRALRV